MQFQRRTLLNIHHQLLELETLLLAADTRRSGATLRALLADDFVEFGASGVAWTRAEVIAGLLQETWVERVISDFAVSPQADAVVLATYVCRHRYPDGSESRSLRSSLWRKQAEGWQMTFHQGTRMAE